MNISRRAWPNPRLTRAYAHYRFGKDVIDCLPLTCRNLVTENRSLFDIGLHGPDILFYHRPLSHDPVNRLGYGMHERPAAEFFQRAAMLYRTSDAPDALRAYLYGFICHFALDSTCHPYIEKMEHDSGLSHAEIETELELMCQSSISRPQRRLPGLLLHVLDLLLQKTSKPL